MHLGRTLSLPEQADNRSPTVYGRADLVVKRYNTLVSMFMLLKGLALGLAVAAPVGPIGLLCIRRTLASGQLAGLCSGLGAATADACYGAVAAFGLTAISGFLLNSRLAFGLVGGVVLFWLGVRTFRTTPVAPAAAPPLTSAGGLLGQYGSTLGLTLTNPSTILSFMAMFAGAGLHTAAVSDAALLVAGVFLGSALWWLALSIVVGVVRANVGPAVLVWINRASGTALALFGVFALVSAAM